MWTPGALVANAPLLRGSMHGSGFFPLFGHQQVRTGYTHRCTKTMLQQFYCAMPIRKRYRTALKKGTMKWCEKRGQVLIPPLIIEGHEKGKTPFKGKFENCRSQRIMFQH